MEKIIVTFYISFGLYALVMCCILADLWSGVRKAKRLGVARTSYGYRRTISKIAQYYNVLIVLTFIDIMQMASLWYLEVYYQHFLPMFPFITLVGAIGICLIEFKSIYEKAEDKVRFDNAGETLGKIITHKNDIEAMVRAFGEYMKSQSVAPTSGKEEIQKSVENEKE